ncbi:uncharacterized protein M6B38_388015 [Iris pallida]|uniref:Uncharacterized protein n=1 Tax=Iris pallida TaxID=29817 RepID=A0AAX6G2D3_IRIPA|nr:uncharacterized protein M6B38_388015 [Iris pallida]
MSEVSAWARTAEVESKQKTDSISIHRPDMELNMSRIRNSFSGDFLVLATDSAKPRKPTAALPAMSAKQDSRIASEPSKTWSQRIRSPAKRVLTATPDVASQ